jgi:hypothetical protein
LVGRPSDWRTCPHSVVRGSFTLWLRARMPRSLLTGREPCSHRGTEPRRRFRFGCSLTSLSSIRSSQPCGSAAPRENAVSWPFPLRDRVHAETPSRGGRGCSVRRPSAWRTCPHSVVRGSFNPVAPWLVQKCPGPR